MKLHFLGATRHVTGSMFMLEVAGRKCLIECGLIQGSPKEELFNTEPFPFDPTQLDAVILTHAHLDHSGRIPLLVNRGYKGPIYTHFATRDLCDILFQDAGYINEKETEWNNRKRMRKDLPLLEPLYTREQAAQSMSNFHTVNYEDPVEVFPGLRLTLHDAGHILGSSIVELHVSESGCSRTVVFSGDLGHRGAPILRDPVYLHHADVVVMEGTYGDRMHRTWDATWAEMQDIMLDPKVSNGNILIPSFAIGRSQEMLYGFARYFDEWHMEKWKIFLDSPLAIKATEIYKKHFHLYDSETLDAWKNHRHPFKLPNFIVSESADQSMALNAIHAGAIIIAGSGMCDGGRIKHHLKHNVWRHNCTILMVGFQARGTLGRQLVDGASHIRLWGETIKVNANIHTIGGFSAHADQTGLSKWYEAFNSRPLLMLVHGEPDALDTLQTHISGKFSAQVRIPQYKEILDLVDIRSH